MQLGATFSHREIRSLKLDLPSSFQTTLDINFDILRLGVYWDESEPKRGNYDFSVIKSLLTQCDQAGQPVVISVGMKAPRWPEYYVPKWLHIDRPEAGKRELLKFISASIKVLKTHNSIIAWQIENEPLDGSGPNKWRIPFDLLADEVAHIRKLDSRPIHINIWGDNITRTGEYDKAAKLADTVGIDLYYKQPAARGSYHGPNFRTWQFIWWRWQQQRKGLYRPLWVTELQAEPWEHSNSAKFTPDPPSINPELLIQNLKNAQKLKPEVILFWGLEYWLWRAKQGNPDLLNTVRYILNDR